MGERRQFEDTNTCLLMTSVVCGIFWYNFSGSLDGWADVVLFASGSGISYWFYETFLSRDGRYEKLVKGIGLKNKEGDYPLLRRKVKTNRGIKLYYTLPPGLNSFDFEKNSMSIKQYLDVKNASFCYAHGNVIVELSDDELDHEYEFELVKKKGQVPVLVGHSLNRIEVVDLAEGEPHMLIAGESGSGKSTVLRAIITSLICNSSRIKLHLIDLKNGAEFSVFEKCKNVISFSKDIKEAEKVLFKLNVEVDRRYKLFYDKNVVDIKEYNHKYPKSKLKREVVIIDEFADLKSEKDSIGILETLSAKARACGIHLIISTQRPDAKILNGRIKANIPRTIALKTMNDVNSRIIIGHNGLEQLRGKGHGILKTEGKEIEIQAMNIIPQQARDLVQEYYRVDDGSIDNGKKLEKKKQGKIINMDFLDKL
ncbi:MAG: DNA translocase FtsK [Desulfobacterales bacterium]|nr:DNA translocase FtsK [Desulfobacterales bacterium]